MKKALSVEKLSCVSQQYAWGKKGAQSAVGLLQARSRMPWDVSAEQLCAAIPQEPFAELWMGTHPSGPSRVLLSAVAADDQEKEGKSGGGISGGGGQQPVLLRDWLGADLPFLFKVLSIDAALSVQAHPDKVRAKSLHERHPDIYKDPNHKPEMATALTPFEAMVGFRPFEQIAAHLKEFDVFREFCGIRDADRFIEAVENKFSTPDQKLKLGSSLLKQMMNSMCSASKSTIESSVTKLIANAQQPSKQARPWGERDVNVRELIVRLHKQHGLDVGVFAPLYLNSFRLEPGETVFLGANVPHAYLSGDCIECMACSDNVVRIGLTPKLRDTATMMEMLDYSPTLPSWDRGSPLDHGILLQLPGVRLFPSFVSRELLFLCILPTLCSAETKKESLVWVVGMRCCWYTVGMLI